MPANEAEEILALALIFVVHVAGGLMLVWGMFGSDTRPGWWPRWGAATTVLTNRRPIRSPRRRPSAPRCR